MMSCRCKYDSASSSWRTAAAAAGSGRPPPLSRWWWRTRSRKSPPWHHSMTRDTTLESSKTSCRETILSWQRRWCSAISPRRPRPPNSRRRARPDSFSASILFTASGKSPASPSLGRQRHTVLKPPSPSGALPSSVYLAPKLASGTARSGASSSCSSLGDDSNCVSLWGPSESKAESVTIQTEPCDGAAEKHTFRSATCSSQVKPSPIPCRSRKYLYLTATGSAPTST
mmetsp:Transcript_51456/g.138637  ORF Transcript_51456/g.138637 Transcript_51456/m.138637 type:complete len:228 (+) Transcript_51456:521-1204(+)